MSRSDFILRIARNGWVCLTFVGTGFAAPPTVASRPFTLDDFKAQIPLSAQGSFLLEIPQILNTAADPEVQAVVAGCSVETCGQVMAETGFNPDGRRLRVARSQIQCCVTHAREYSVVLDFAQKAPAFQEMAWVKLLGTLSYEQQGGKPVAVILVKEIQEVAKPENPLLR